MPDHNDVLVRLKAGKSASVRAMAEVIGCHPNTLWKAIREGEVKAVRIGKVVSIPSPEGLRLVGLDAKAAA